MKNIFTGQAYSYTQGFNVLSEIRPGLPATLSLALGAGFIWLFDVDRVRDASLAIKAGKYDRSGFDDAVAMFGVSFPPFFLGAILIYYLGVQARHLPDRWLRAADSRTPASGSCT